MYLERMKINHFRKFNENDNEVVFYNNQAIKENIDISNVSTLIVGQNNAGKSTIFKAFELLVSNGVFTSKDFNCDYLKDYLEKIILDIRDENNEIICPFIKFEFSINLSDNDDEVITQAISLINISATETDKNEGNLYVYIRLKDENLYRKFIEDELKNYKSKKSNSENNDQLKRELVEKTTNKIDEIGLTYDFYNSQKKIDFKFSNLFNFKLIDALSVNDECILSKQFKSILKYHFSNGNIVKTKEMDEKINDINIKISELLKDKPTNFINAVIENMLSANRVEMKLQSSLTFESILDNNVKYFYSENNYYIPEDHYGLGYTKLISIVANLLDYIEKKPEKDLDNKISIIAIEEPETFMHPQLQKCFIKNINTVLNNIIKGSDKKIKCQIIISTHSPHIVSNKIELSNSINNINYLGLIKNKTKIVLLKDSMFETKNNIPFTNIKKHMSLNLAEALFADAVILVEGFAEEKMIPYFLTNYDNLKNRYITIVNIRGAHGLIFEKLLKALQIPATIITDVDFISENDDQIIDYRNQKTSNHTIIKFNNNSNDLNKLKNCKIDINDNDNLKIFIQETENGFCGTSFEEALILANYNNQIIMNALKDTHKNKIKALLRFDENDNLIDNNELLNNSKKIYNIISDKKAEFILNVIKNSISSTEVLNTPSYITKTFDFLTEKVNEND